MFFALYCLVRLFQSVFDGWGANYTQFVITFLLLIDHFYIYMCLGEHAPCMDHAQ